MGLKLRALCTLTLITFSLSALAQAPKKPNAAELKQALNKLEVLGTVMYLAAHPDDENTRLIAYMANEKKLRTAYLAMTRGDGGQNLIGNDIREYLGIIRTQELLAARRTDGGEQFFTRANDFGFSKDPDETFNIWEKDDVLADVIWNIRRFRPDVIITRFDTARDNSGRMHGHHTASALLAQEAFEKAADPGVFPEQLKYLDTWQPKGLYWNTYNFGGQFTSSHENESGYFELDLGAYNELLGLSYDEISALSRSNHKSQGFGSTGRRGELKEYLMHWKGELPRGDIFANIDQTWSRVEGGEEIGRMIQRANEDFDMQNPSSIVPQLVQIKGKIDQLKNSYWKEQKLKEIEEIIKGAMGLFLEVRANDYSATPGETVTLNIEAINRSGINAELKKISFSGRSEAVSANQVLANNDLVNLNTQIKITEENSQPYWLKDEAALGMYTVADQQLRGLPENPPAITATLDVEIAGESVQFEVPVVYKENDRVDGEVYRPFVITPPVFVSMDASVIMFPDQEAKSVEVLVKSGKDNVSGVVNLQLPDGWKASQNNLAYQLKKKGDEQRFQLEILPPGNASEAYMTVEATYQNKVYDRSLRVVDYDHIPTQTTFPKSEVKIVKLDLQKKGQYIGYIMGSGDDIPASLEQVGYTVDILDPEKINQETLNNYDAVIVGVRAYNTIERMNFIQPELMKYVETGGTVITQYNTSMRDQPAIGPYEFSISRDRVTVEEAEVRILAEDHPIINGPNKITAKDFEGWVQERGLYFPNEWDEHYTPILSANDPGETPKNGGLLVTKFGEGYFVYSGYSWFRELPAGVPGAFRIFTNMISLGQDNPKSASLKSVENK
ncbi:PIG-L family deacetylase [Roseivirga sp.]|uniref:PIG-L family deacetylase n=1 Tax=Roseivirga sp. TaxID=1964215 RepID=UPI003B51C262